MNNKDDYSNEIRKIIKLIFVLFIKGIKLLPSLISSLYKNILKRIRFSISFKITLVYFSLFAKILFFLSITLWGLFAVYSINLAEENMTKDFKLTSYYLEKATVLPTKEITQLSLLDDIKITLFDANNKVLFSTDTSSSAGVFYSKKGTNNVANLNNNFMFAINNDQLKKDTFSLILNKNITWNSNSIFIQINNNLSKEVTNLLILIIILSIINLLFIILSIPPGAKASKKMLRPVEKMTKTVKNITINALDTRLDISGSQDELKELAETFNNMLDRIQQSYELQNQFVSDASHELRTPISVIAGYVNLLDRWGKNDKAILEESIQAIKTESESMKDLIENLLFLARGDKNTQKIEVEPFYINELIEEVIKETKLIDTDHEISSTASHIIQVNADRKLIKQTLRIFIDNSIKYTQPGGKIIINCLNEKNLALITIEDNGIGISKEDLPNIFNRFYRADKSRTKETGGTGLGLSIAKWIILKHKGFIEVESRLNLGTKISIKLGKIGDG
ncbi:MAG: HAMP domain-containing histidine kinase [Clostridiaceae bacterium]|nr:HAMP domain-containing histidine kinase [Clostridiaceae bacterium]